MFPLSRRAATSMATATSAGTEEAVFASQHQLGEALSAVFDPTFIHDLSVVAYHAHPMLLRAPVNTNVMLKLQVVSFRSDLPCRISTPVLALWRRKLPTGFSTRTTTPGRWSFPGARLAQGAVGAPGGQSSLYWLTTSSSYLERYRGLRSVASPRAPAPLSTDLRSPVGFKAPAGNHSSQSGPFVFNLRYSGFDR